MAQDRTLTAIIIVMQLKQRLINTSAYYKYSHKQLQQESAWHISTLLHPEELLWLDGAAELQFS